MALQSVNNAVAGTVNALWEANGDYENLKADQDLAPAFHRAGQLVLPVGKTVFDMQIWLQQHTLDGDSDANQIARVFGECGQKAEALRLLFRELVTESDTPRKDRYLKYVREKGEGHAAEVLMINIMKDMCRATKHSSAFGSAMQEQVQQLQAAMADLEALPPSVPPQSLTVLSLEADARSCPSCENTNKLTQLPWPSSVFRHPAVAVFHILINRSLEAEAR